MVITDPIVCGGCVCAMLSHVRLFGTSWRVAYQAPLSLGFPRQEYWSGLSFSSPGDLPNPGTEPLSPKSPALASRLFTIKPPRKPRYKSGNINKMFQLRQCWSSSIFLPRHIGEMTFRIWIYSSEYPQFWIWQQFLHYCNFYQSIHLCKLRSQPSIQI